MNGPLKVIFVVAIVSAPFAAGLAFFYCIFAYHNKIIRFTENFITVPQKHSVKRREYEAIAAEFNRQYGGRGWDF